MERTGRSLRDRIPLLTRVWREHGLGSPGAQPDRGLTDGELRSVAARVRDLSRGLTRLRSLAGAGYFSDPQLLGAYHLYYWPVSYALCGMLLREIPSFAAQASCTIAQASGTIAQASGAGTRREAAGSRTPVSGGGGPRPGIREPASGVRASAPGIPARRPQAWALDLGAGSGAFSLALLDRGFGQVAAWDRSAEGLAWARRTAELSGYRLETRVWDALGTENPTPGGSGRPAEPPGPVTDPASRYDLLTAGHLFNELWEGRPDRVELRFDLLRRLSGLLTPRGVVLLADPALPATAADLLRLRDRLVSAGWRILAPCSYTGPCPALAAGGTCHGEWDWTPPRIVRDIGRMSRVSPRENLKAAYLLASPPGHSPDEADAPAAGVYRVVSDGMLSKSGRLRHLVCGPDGRFALSAKRETLPPEAQAFLSLRRGDLIRFSGAQERETGRGLGAGSSLELLRRREDPA